jgi:hypothetical protein
MQFELWDVDGANLVGFFAAEDEALNVVRDMVDTYGPDSVATYVLSTIGDNGARDVVADGNALVRLAARRVQRLAPASSST